MNITLQHSDPVNATLTIDITKDDYLPQTEKALAHFRKNFAMKGFRKGMVPAGMVRKMYGTSVMLDEVNKILADSVNKYIEEQKLDILGRPLPVPSDAHFDIQHPSDYSFTFELGLSPDFSLDVLSKDTVVKMERVQITDEELDKELDNLRSRYGILVDVDGDIQDKDVLKVKLVELENGQPKEGGVVASGPINVEIVKDEALKAELLKAKVGDTFTIKLFEVLDRERPQIIKFILGLKEEPAQLGEEFAMTIEKISRMQKADLNEEFFARIWPDGSVKDEASAKERLREELRAYLSIQESHKLNNQLFELLIDKTEMQLPDDFLKRWIKHANEKPLTDEQVEAEYPAFARNLKWSLIVKKITRENNLKADFDEINEASKTMLREEFARYGMGNLPDDQLEEFNRSMLAKEDHVKKTYDAVMEQKLFNFIKEQVTIEEVWVPYGDFFKR